MPSIFAISDTWFNRLLDDDPNENIVDNNEHIIQVWNETVSPDDKVYVLGGFGIGDLYYILTRLNGEIHFLDNYFNGDEKSFISEMKSEVNKSSDSKFKSRVVFEKNQILVLPKYDVVLSYFPLESWLGKSSGTYCFHGLTETTDLLNHNISCISKKWECVPVNIISVQHNIESIDNIFK